MCVTIYRELSRSVAISIKLSERDVKGNTAQCLLGGVESLNDFRRLLRSQTSQTPPVRYLDCAIVRVRNQTIL